MSAMRQCHTCGTKKPLDQFARIQRGRGAQGWDTHSTVCRACLGGEDRANAKPSPKRRQPRGPRAQPVVVDWAAIPHDIPERRSRDDWKYRLRHPRPDAGDEPSDMDFLGGLR